MSSARQAFCLSATHFEWIKCIMRCGEDFVMNSCRVLQRRQISRRVSLTFSAMLISSILTSCSNYDVQTGGTASDVPSTASSVSPDRAPKVKAVQLKVSGDTVKPISGITVSLAEGTVGLSPERLSENHVAVTYVWPNEKNWGYLAVEGPMAFDSSPDEAVKAAIAADRDLLAKQGVATNVEDSIPWKGFSHCGQLTWRQLSIPPGWNERTLVDALSLYVIDGQNRTNILTAYVPQNGFTEGNPAFTTLCSLAAS